MHKKQKQTQKLKKWLIWCANHKKTQCGSLFDKGSDSTHLKKRKNESQKQKFLLLCNDKINCVILNEAKTSLKLQSLEQWNMTWGRTFDTLSLSQAAVWSDSQCLLSMENAVIWEKSLMIWDKPSGQMLNLPEGLSMCMQCLWVYLHSCSCTNFKLKCTLQI